MCINISRIAGQGEIESMESFHRVPVLIAAGEKH